MKVIELTRGQVALVDNKHFDWLNQYSWHCTNKGYAAARVNGTFVLMHRLIMNAPPGVEIDHIDGEKSNNQESNLRLASRAENAWNSKKPCGARSLYKGVSWSRGLWVASIKVNGKRYHLGCYKTQTTAALAYDHAARKHFGKFARLNFPDIETTDDNIRLPKIPTPTPSLGEKNGSSILTDESVRSIRRLWAEGVSMTRLADQFLVSIANISGVCHRKYWKHID